MCDNFFKKFSGKGGNRRYRYQLRTMSLSFRPKGPASLSQGSQASLLVVLVLTPDSQTPTHLGSWPQFLPHPVPISGRKLESRVSGRCLSSTFAARNGDGGPENRIPRKPAFSAPARSAGPPPGSRVPRKVRRGCYDVLLRFPLEASGHPGSPCSTKAREAGPGSRQ